MTKMHFLYDWVKKPLTKICFLYDWVNPTLDENVNFFQLGKFDA